MENKYNLKESQGRSKKKYESYVKNIFWALLAFMSVITLFGIYKLIMYYQH